MRPTIRLPFFALMPYFAVADAGGGAGGGTGAPAGGSGSPSSGAPAGGSGTPISLTADSLFTPPGATAPVKYADFIAGYVPKADHETWETNRSRAEAALIARAAEVDRKHKEWQDGQRKPPQTPPDPTAGLDDLAIVDGTTLAKLYRDLDANGLTPIRKMMETQNQTIIGLQRQLQTINGHVGSFANERTEGAFVAKLDAAVKGLGEIPTIPEAAVLRELADDIYRSHEPSQELDQKFPSMVAERVATLRKVFRAMDKAEAEARLKARRLPPSHGGTTTPNGQRPQLESSANIAARYFPPVGAGAT